MEPPAGEVTRLLAELRSGNAEAEAQLIPLVYSHLHDLAKGYMRRERPDHTLQPTALLNEAYLRLVSQEGTVWQDRTQFFRVASRLMREILVDYARARQTQKRGGKAETLPLDQVAEFSPEISRELFESDKAIELEELIDLDDALKSLGRLQPRQERVVESRFFGGLTEEETADSLGVSLRTVKRDWRVARAWLYAELSAKAKKH
jgi:RNA polymerase sigma factor (TIGR02999 family)